MEEDIKALKQALGFLEAKYIMSQTFDDYAFIRFNYKDKNYILHVNYQYRFMALEETDSLKEISLDEDVSGLLEDIRLVKSGLQIGTYNIFAIAARNEMTEEGLDKSIELTKEVNNVDMAFSCGFVNTNKRSFEGSIIPYCCGLNSFDERIFPDKWLEDFNDKLTTYYEEDLYIVFSTLTSYFYKISQNKWEGYIIDPFVISDALEMLLIEIK